MLFEPRVYSQNRQRPRDRPRVLISPGTAQSRQTSANNESALVRSSFEPKYVLKLSKWSPPKSTVGAKIGSNSPGIEDHLVRKRSCVISASPSWAGVSEWVCFATST